MATVGEGLLFMPVEEISTRIRAGGLSAVALTEAYLERAQKYGAKLNAFATLMPEAALQYAREMEKELYGGKYRSPLHGIPFVAKDLLATKGTPTTWGARPFANQKFDYNATVIQRLQDAGAILMGKSAMIELAGGMGYRFASASLTGAAKNPWNTACWTCGSSSGSGAVIAAAMAGFAIGSETWGSIICPAAFCGATGMRPTHGRVSRHGAMALSYSMDKIGPICRSAGDCGTVLATISGHDAKDPGSAPNPQAKVMYPGGAIRKRVLRVGWITNQWKTIDPKVETAARNAVNALKREAVTVEDAKIPDGPWEAAAGTIISVEGVSAFEPLITSGKIAELIDPLGRIGGYVSQQIPASDYVRAMRVRAVLQQEMHELFEKYDALACASLPITASLLDANLETDLSFPDPIGAIGNLCGLPAISIPCGFTDRKLPVGVQFIGPVMGDEVLIRLGKIYQTSTNFHVQRPALT